tara:strand:+ start:1961 stop:2122 length:162 start_codon:yes stop_codon:yes gene_type:complete
MNHKDITVDDVMNMNVSSLDEAVKKVAKKYDISEEEAKISLTELTEKSDKKLF